MTFVLALEILAIKIRAASNIKGIKLPNGLCNEGFNVTKILLYADDVTLFVQEKQDLKNALTLVSFFTKFSGLAMNRNKSEAMWLGSKKDSNEQFGDLKWKRCLKILGIYVRNDLCASSIEENWLPRIDKINRIIQSWYKRNLSIMGKICIVKSLLISQFTYAMQALSAPSDILKQINTIIFRFIWKKQYSNTRAFEKVKRKVMCKDYEEGGLKMINLIDMQNSFLLCWANKLLATTNSKWKCIPRAEFSSLGGILACFYSNVNIKQFKGLSLIRNVFWKNVLRCWIEQFYNENRLSIMNVPAKSQIIWNNNDVKFKGNTLLLKDWIKGGFCIVNDVLDDNNMVLPLETINQKIGFKPSRIFEHGAVSSAIYSLLKRNSPPSTEACSVSGLGTPQLIRKYLINREETIPVSSNFWLNNFNVVITKDDWLRAKRCTDEIRLRLLHWKIVHHIYPTNILLSKMGITRSHYCSFCPDKIDFVEHFFFSCTKISKIWKCVSARFQLKFEKEITFTPIDVLLGKRKLVDMSITEYSFVNNLILIAKMCIGIFRYGTPLNIEYLFERELCLRNL
jgi:hypothetical protein